MRDEDAELAKRVAQGSERAFEEVVRKYGGLIKAVVNYHLNGSMEQWREDCVNEVLLAIWQNTDRYAPEKNSLKNWIGAVARYKAINYKRRYIKEQNRSELSETMAASDRADSRIMKEELEREIEGLLSGLNEQDRRIFKRRYLEDAEIAEIARAEGKSGAWVYNRLSRGRRRLRERSGRYEE